MVIKTEAKNEQAHEAELAVIGSVLLDASQISIVRSIVSDSDFSNDQHRRFFKVLSLLHDANEPIGDIICVSNGLSRMGAFDFVGGSYGIAKAFQSVPHAGNAVYYAKRVAADAALRKQIELAGEMLQRASTPGADPEANREWMEANLAAVTRNTIAKVRSVGEIAMESVDAIEADIKAGRRPGVMTGIYKFDSSIGSLMCGELIIIAARPSIGKTALGLQIAEHVAMKGHRSLAISLEMRDRELVDRMLSNLAEIDSRKIRTRRKLDAGNVAALRTAAESLATVPMRVWDPASATIDQIKGIAKIEHVREPLSLIVVDYIGLVETNDRYRPRHEQIGQVSRALKGLAKELDIPIIALCQLTRDAETEVPNLSNLRDSGSIEQDADVVIFLHKNDRKDATARLIVEKNRNGVTGEMVLNWEAATTRFYDPNAPQAHGVFNDYNNS